MIQVHDFVAILKDIEDTPVRRGTTGTVISKLPDSCFLVEFSNNTGAIYEQIEIHQDDLLVLYQIIEDLEV